MRKQVMRGLGGSPARVEPNYSMPTPRTHNPLQPTAPYLRGPFC
jgi:hypothetical protein